MKYDYKVVVDGVSYEPGVEVPDLGSITCISAKDMLRNYTLLSKDVDKLPTYDNLKSGSTALVVDTSEVYVYELTTKTWYQQGA